MNLMDEFFWVYIYEILVMKEYMVIKVEVEIGVVG